MAISPELAQRIRRDYPAWAHLLDNPEVADLLGRAANEGWDLGTLQANVYATTWWKTTTEAQRRWDTTVATDGASAQEQRQQKWISIRSEAARLGVRLTEAQIIQISEGALRSGWTEEQTRQLILSKANSRTYQAGTVRASAQEIRALSRAYGVPLGSSIIWNWAQRIAMGSMDMEGVKSGLVDYAKDRFNGNNGLLRALDKGYTVEDYMAPVLSRVADELGVNPNSFDLTTGMGRQILDFRDSETGEMRVMTDTEAIQFARSHGSWRDQAPARTLATQLADGITQKMGVRS